LSQAPMNGWELLIQALVAVGTLAVAALAIWGEWFREKLAGPKLELTLHDPEGEPIPVRDGTPPTFTPARFYHLKVANKRRWAPAKNVRVLLTKVNKPAADGSFPIVALSGPLQLTWQHPELHPLFPTIGPDDICDLGNLQKGRVFTLSPYLIPNNFQGSLPSAGKIRVEVVAAADDAESNPLLIEIAWDGEWSDDTATLSKHLVVKQVASI
jgi:hypothetical protein